MSFNNHPNSESSGYEALRNEVISNKDILYVVHSGILNETFFSHTTVQCVGHTEDFSNVVRAGSWDSFSPRYLSQVKSFEIDPNHLLTSTTQDKVRYIDIDDQSMITFLREHADYGDYPSETTLGNESCLMLYDF